MSISLHISVNTIRREYVRDFPVLAEVWYARNLLNSAISGQNCYICEHNVMGFHHDSADFCCWYVLIFTKLAEISHFSLNMAEGSELSLDSTHDYISLEMASLEDRGTQTELLSEKQKKYRAFWSAWSYTMLHIFQSPLVCRHIYMTAAGSIPAGFLVAHCCWFWRPNALSLAKLCM